MDLRFNRDRTITIGRSSQDYDSSKRDAWSRSLIVMNLHRTAQNQKRLYKRRSLRREKPPAINLRFLLVYEINSCAVSFPVIVTSFRFNLMHKFQVWSKEKEEITSWTSIFVFKNSEWKALHPAINWIISKANLG